MLFDRDADDMPNLHRDRASSFQIVQIEDDYENEPLISKEQFFKRMRGRKGAYPPIKQMSKNPQDLMKTPVYVSCQINEITTIDTKTNTFTVRIQLMLVFDIDVAGTTARLEEELQECIDEGRETFMEDRKKKVQLWTELIENCVDDGTPYKIEDEEYEVFEEEIDWPESMELFNKITEDQSEPAQFFILDKVQDKDGSVKTATVWMDFMEGLYECKEFQELEFFPFDLQDLTLDFQLTSRHDIDRFDFRLHTVEFYRPCLQMAEWVMYPPECDRKGTAKTSVRLRAARKPRYYITNIVGMMCILNMMCIAAFGVGMEEVADRLSVTMTMMLTAVAFKFIVGDQLPKVSYNTYLDIYLLYTMCFMFLCSIYFCAAPHFWKWAFGLDDIMQSDDYNSDLVPKVFDADYWVCVVFSLGFVFFTGYWFHGAREIVAAVLDELPPPIKLDHGDEYISYRWQKVPFAGFENPMSEREQRGEGAKTGQDPTYIDRALTNEGDSAFSPQSAAFQQMQNLGGAATEDTIITETLKTDADDDAQGGSLTPSTFEIESGTLPAVITSVNSPSSTTPSYKRTPRAKFD